jgi:hypothetical protein
LYVTGRFQGGLCKDFADIRDLHEAVMILCVEDDRAIVEQAEPQP